MDTQLQQIDQRLNAREIKKAEVLIARYLRADPGAATRAQLLLRRARARLIGQHPDDALADLDAVKALQPETVHSTALLELAADAYFGRFELSPVGFAERSDATHALALYQQIIDGDPDYDNMGWVLYQKGRVLLTVNRVEEAVACLQGALLKPSQVAALTALCYERLGFIYLFDLRDPATALTFFDRAAVTYPPSEPEGWLEHLHILRSRALREQGRHAEALGAAQQALQTVATRGADIRDVRQDAHLMLGEILADMPGREAEAAEHLQQFLQLDRRPIDVDVTWSRVNELLGDMLFRLERYEAAIEAYNNALSFNPYHPWEVSLYYQIARCYYRLHAYEKTVAAIQQAQRAATEESHEISDYRVFRVLGNAHFALEQYGEAIAAYEQAMKLAPAQADDLEQTQTYLRLAKELGAP